MHANGILLLRRVLEYLETDLICLRWFLEHALNHLYEVCFSNRNEYRLVFENSSLIFNELWSCVAVKGKRLCSRWHVTQFQLSWNLVPVDMELCSSWYGIAVQHSWNLAGDEKTYCKRWKSVLWTLIFRFSSTNVSVRNLVWKARLWFVVWRARASKSGCDR